jgi:1-aminocyclopropane-1-carboxylate deaminase
VSTGSGTASPVRADRSMAMVSTRFRCASAAVACGVAAPVRSRRQEGRERGSFRPGNTGSVSAWAKCHPSGRLSYCCPLTYAVSRGMHLTYLDRAAYRNKTSAEVIGALHEQFGEFFLLPEGGSNENAVRGCAEIPAEISQPFDMICCPCGTGGTLAGIAHGLAEGQRALGFAVLKGGEFLTRQVEELQVRTFGASSANWAVEYDFHFGGFAKRRLGLDEFITDFQERHGLILDWVYTAKMMYGIYALAGSAVFPAGAAVVAVITG